MQSFGDLPAPPELDETPEIDPWTDPSAAWTEEEQPLPKEIPLTAPEADVLEQSRPT